MGLAFVILASCYYSDPGCFVPNVHLWCMDTLAEEMGERPCGEPPGDPSYRCGPYDVVTSGPGYTGVEHFFARDSGKHVATAYWTDINTECGGFESWYGRRIECRPTCSYVDDPQLPPCD